MAAPPSNACAQRATTCASSAAPQGQTELTGDVTTGAGLVEAMVGVDTVLHLATSAGKKDVQQTRNVVDAARAAGVTHLVYISIVGVDVNPYP